MPNSTAGSVWRKWDFHVHTPASYGEHSLGSDWNTYVERLIDAANIHKISAFATADYFTIFGYKKLLDYYNRGTRVLATNGKSAELLIIPGIELRLNIFNVTNEAINIHVLFDPESCSSAFIQQNFLEELSVSYRGSPVPLKPQNLLAIGKSIDESKPLNLGYDFSAVDESQRENYVRKALSSITLSHGNIEDALKEIGAIFERQKLPAKAALIAIVGKGHGGIDSLRWFEENKQFSRAGLIREHLAHQADIIFSNDPKDRAFYLGQREDTPPQEVESRFNNRKPCVWGSDANSLDNLFHPSNGNTDHYTWIDADVTYEGLKQIIYEPELRVRVQQDNPSEEETYARIDNLQVDFPLDLKIKDKESTEATAFCITGNQQILFSPNLTCVIGGEGQEKVHWFIFFTISLIAETPIALRN